MYNFIQNVERSISVAINGAWSPTLDSICLLISNKWSYLGLYIIIAIYICCRSTYVFDHRKVYNNWKISAVIILSILVTFFITDKVSHDIIKPLVARLRPGYDPYIWSAIRTPAGKGGIYSFVSNHAANFFGFATLSSLVIKRKPYTIFIFVVAIAIGYSRIYLGRHFLGDVLCGALFGFIVALIAYLFIKRLILRRIE